MIKLDLSWSDPDFHGNTVQAVVTVTKKKTYANHKSTFVDISKLPSLPLG
jgi:hypothetical protein